MMRIYSSALTDVGKQRELNEDTFILQTMEEGRYVLAAAIDGMGGYEGGEVAAAIARDEIVTYMTGFSDKDNGQCLKEAVIVANNAIVERRRQDLKRSEMGCVLTAVLVDAQDGKGWMVHVGDTRLYRYANGSLEKLSHDMSLVGYREEVGNLTEEEAMNHPQRNIIDKAAGSQILTTDDRDYLETLTFDIQEGDCYMLCSDGLCDMITSVTMKSILCCKKEEGYTQEDVDKKTNQLVEAANVAGGKDNITVVLLQVDETEKKAPADRSGVEEQLLEAEIKDESFHDDRVIVTELKVEDNQQKDNCQGKVSRTFVFLLFIVVCLVAGGAYWFGLCQGRTERLYMTPVVVHDTIIIEVVDSMSMTGDSLIQ